MQKLISIFKKGGYLSPEIERAFSKIDRADFVPDNLKEYAYEDVPLSIGFGQTISQPQVVAFMINLLSVKEDDNILDIGFGSGWTTALLAEIAKEGRVTAIEKIPEIFCFGKKNIDKYNFIKKKKVELFLGDGRKGKKENAPYNKVLVSAADSDYRFCLGIKDQLQKEAKIVIPINSSIFLFTKSNNDFKKEEYRGFSFVSLV